MARAMDQSNCLESGTDRIQICFIIA